MQARSSYYQGSGARSYDQRHHHFTERTLSETLALIDVEATAHHTESLQRAPRLLDVACGTGVLLSLLHERFPSAELYGVDGSQDMLALAQKRLGGEASLRLEQVVIGPSTQAGLPFPEGSFDLITCTNALHAMPDPVSTLADLLRLLAPDGHLLLEDFFWRSPSFSRWLFKWLASRLGAGPLHPYTLTEACSLCEQAGLFVRASRSFVIDWLLRGWVISIVKL
jgi:ubiquinone/menaquinone biosynthesis C-methylase UbiE